MTKKKAKKKSTLPKGLVSAATIPAAPSIPVNVQTPYEYPSTNTQGVIRQPANYSAINEVTGAGNDTTDLTIGIALEDGILIDWCLSANCQASSIQQPNRFQLNIQRNQNTIWTKEVGIAAPGANCFIAGSSNIVILRGDTIFTRIIRHTADVGARINCFGSVTLQPFR